jgi:serine/threonine protein kinase
MTTEFTQQQTPADLVRSKDLSLARTRPPTEVPGFQATKFIGAGAYGEVWAGVDRNTGRKVAIKFYAHRSGVDWSLLNREVEKLRFLSADRYVVQLLQVGWTAEPPYYVMELVENGSLDDLLKQHGTFTVPEAVETFREIAIGLAHAHGKGILHCDLKPANILLDQDHRPRLADFGQSRLSHEQKPALGTLFYMAPEQADLEAVPDVRWDVYALGAILHCLLLGYPPHRNDATANRA